VAERYGAYRHDEIDGIEVFPAGEAAGEIGGGIGSGVESVAEWALEAEDAAMAVRIEFQDGCDDEPDGEIVSEEEKLVGGKTFGHGGIFGS
jgi:hypothetical protein